MPHDFENFFILTGSISATLWAVALAILALTLSSSLLPGGLGHLSAISEEMSAVADKMQLSLEMRQLYSLLRTQYRGLWFLIQLLPMLIFFQVAMLLSIAAAFPGLPLTWAWAVPLTHIAAWTYLVRLLKKGDVARKEAIERAGIVEADHNLPDKGALTFRALLPQFLLLAIGFYIIVAGGTQLTIAVSIAASLVFGFICATKILTDLAFSKGA